MEKTNNLRLDTLLVHGDRTEEVGTLNGPIASEISVSATFSLAGVKLEDTHSAFTYARHDTPTRARLEKVLAKLESNEHVAVTTYSSGLAASHAALVFFNPRKIAISGGYYGTHAVISELQKLNKDLVVVGKQEVESLGEGDLLWLETPLNADVHVDNVKEYVLMSKKQGFKICVDSTFAPPPIQNLMNAGEESVDMVMHSGTKFFGGHSDALMGVLFVKGKENDARLKDIRTNLGAVPGNLETWLLLRSMKTLSLRVFRQNESALFLAIFLSILQKEEKLDSDEISQSLKTKLTLLDTKFGYKYPTVNIQHQVKAILDGFKTNPVYGKISQVNHPSLTLLDNMESMGWLKAQMPGGLGSLFSFSLHKEEDAAKIFESNLTHLWQNATSLGGVESLIDYRGRWDATSGALVRLSTGTEDVIDLSRDLLYALSNL